MSSSDCLVVIPSWNEGRRLPGARFLEHIARGSSPHFLFVDDGSTDDTPSRLAALAAAAPDHVSVLTQRTNQGKGEAVRVGLLEAARRGYPIAGFLDADLSAPLESIALLRTALDSNDALRLVIGSRVKLLGWQISRSELRHYVGRVFATMASLALSLPVYDTQCGAKLLRMDASVQAALAAPFDSRWLFDVELIARLRDRVGVHAMREAPLESWHDSGGSHLRPWDFLAAPAQLLKIWRRYPPGARR